MSRVSLPMVALKSPVNPADVRTRRLSPADMKHIAGNFSHLRVMAAIFMGKRRVPHDPVLHPRQPERVPGLQARR